MKMKKRQIGVASAFIDACLSRGKVAFPLVELMGTTGLSAIAAKYQLLRLGERVIRVSPRQPFYLIVTPEHRVIGAPPVVCWLEDYFVWLGCPYYVALQSAASLFGSNPQALQVTQVMIEHPHRPLQVGRVQVRFFVKRGIERTPSQQIARSPAPLRVSTPEATVFDLIRYAASIGGVERSAETIRPLLPLCRARELKRVLNAENELATTQRLGYIFDLLGAYRMGEVVRVWLPSKLMPTPLIPCRGDYKTSAVVARWQVFNNSKELSL